MRDSLRTRGNLMWKAIRLKRAPSDSLDQRVGRYAQVKQLWNLPAVVQDRYDLFSQIVEAFLTEQAIHQCRFLEIGVWKPAILPNLVKRLGPIFDYVGVDPYGRLESDPYQGLFWSSPEEADAVYEVARESFAAHNAKLLRSTSQAFFASNVDDFDIIFVDGDHRYQGCRDDCEAALAHIKPGGLLIIDDYGNSFHPEVELAVRKFAHKHAARIAQAGWHPLFFRLDGMIAPVMLAFMCFQIAKPKRRPT
jgi:SAM-dependent methyltransferase